MNIRTHIPLAIALILAVPALVSAAAPSNPPSNNVSAPVNVGNAYQYKTGTLQVGVLGVDGGALFGSSVGIGIGSAPSYKLQVGASGDGSAVASNAFFYLSDASLKKNISTLPDALSKVLQLRGVSYEWKKTGKSDIGLIAQEVERVYPQAVNTDREGIKAVEYGHLVGPLIEAIKAQQAEIETLKARIQALEAR